MLYLSPNKTCMFLIGLALFLETVSLIDTGDINKNWNNTCLEIKTKHLHQRKKIVKSAAHGAQMQPSSLQSQAIKKTNKQTEKKPQLW